jgi:hypothetical protein
LTGRDFNGELRGVSEPFRGVAGRLNRLPAESRQEPWDEFLSARDDQEDIIRAMAAVDPLGPAPDRDDPSPSDDWPPLRFGGLPPVDPFPVDVLPEPAARLVVEGADAIGCPPDFLGVPALAVTGGTIGRSVALLLKQAYFANATLYAACVGPPSDGKTPALRLVAGAVRRIDESLETEHTQAIEHWRAEADRSGGAGKKAKPPPLPKPRRIDIDDITMETVPNVLADNPRGLIRINDELTAFLLGMNQFKGGKGNDRPNALKIWSGDAIKKDRVGHEANAPIRCPHPAMTIVGGLPPDMLGFLLDPKGRADGFIDRFLLTYPDPLPVPDWNSRGVPEETSEGWHSLVARLWQRPMNDREGRPVPHAARFTPEGEATWKRCYDDHAAEMNADDFPPSLRGPWGKLREYAGRLALILACLDHAADPIADPLAVPSVGPRAVRNAWRLVAYFKSHARRVHATIALGTGVGGGPVVRAVVDWIRSGRRVSFSERDVKQARRWITDDDLAEALDHLAERNAVRPREAPPDRAKGGRPASPVYDVNPALLDTQNPQNPQNPDCVGGFEGSEGFENG